MANSVIESVAAQLHRNYRSAQKALSSQRSHDHGWKKCHRKKYFLKRAKLLIAQRAEVQARIEMKR